MSATASAPRTLEYLLRHLARMARHSANTSMHARNLAIVWAPNLLRYAFPLWGRLYSGNKMSKDPCETHVSVQGESEQAEGRGQTCGTWACLVIGRGPHLLGCS